MECFASNLSSHIADTTRSLALGEYRFSEIRPISIPKGPHGTRPGSIIALRDRVTLWAITTLLAPALDAALVDGVLSYRVRRPYRSGDFFEEIDEIAIPFLKGSFVNSRISPFSSWYYNWREFDALSKKAFDSGHKYLAVTDISAYFENINLDILRDLLLKFHPQDHRTVNMLIEALCSWTVATPTGHRPKRGIPQGSGISSFLGNIFLMPVDKAISSHPWTSGIVYLRYMDDIRVFCKNKNDAIKAILLLESELRKIHLSVQSAKTKVLGQVEIKELLFDSRIDQIKAIRAAHPAPTFATSIAVAKLARVGSSTGSGEALARRFENRTGLLERATRMWMNSLMYYGSTAYIGILTHVIVKNADPRYSEIFVRTAKRFPNFSYNMAQIYSYLSSDANIYEYHECTLLEACRYMTKRSAIIYRRCIQIINGDNSYNLKLAAIRYLAKWRLSGVQLRAVERAQQREKFIPCAMNYILILRQMNGVDFSIMISRIGRIPSAQSVDTLEFVRQIQQYSAFTKGFLAFMFDAKFRFRLSDWIGVLWVMSHTNDSRLKRHLAGLARRRILSEPDTLITTALGAIGARLI